MLKTIAVKSLKPNPFRRLDEYPIIREKVDALKESIGATGFWGTIVGRPKAGGLAEIAFGHHRLVALQESGIDQVEIIIRDLTNEQMIKMMARENMEEWGTSAWVELETIRSVIEAYGKGMIQLPKVPKNAPQTREVIQGSGLLYTKSSIAEFLGWTSKQTAGTLKPNYACDTAFRALDMIDKGFLQESFLKGLTRAQMGEVVECQWKIYRAESELASRNRKDAEIARDKAAMTAAPVERRRLETQAKVYSEQAEQHEAAACAKASDFAREASSLFHDGEGMREVRKKAAERTPEVPRQSKIHNVDELADRISAKLLRIANDDDDLSGDVALLKQCKNDLSDRAAASLCQSFTSLIGRLERMRNAFKASS